MVMLTACQSERLRGGGLCTGMHERQVQMLNDLMEATGVDPERLCTYCWDGRE